MGWTGGGLGKQRGSRVTSDLMSVIAGCGDGGFPANVVPEAERWNCRICEVDRST